MSATGTTPPCSSQIKLIYLLTKEGSFYIKKEEVHKYNRMYKGTKKKEKLISKYQLTKLQFPIQHH